MVEYAGYYNFHRLHGEIGWLTPERYTGMPFTDRGFEHIPALRPVADYSPNSCARPERFRPTGEHQLAATQPVSRASIAWTRPPSWQACC